MDANSTTSITAVLQRMRGTRADLAFDKLLTLSRSTLLKIARTEGRSMPDPASSPTDLLQEFSVRLWSSRRRCEFPERRSFFRFARKVMRHFFRDEVDRNQAKKRGGDHVKLSIDEGLLVATSEATYADRSVLAAALDTL